MDQSDDDDALLKAAITASLRDTQANANRDRGSQDRSVKASSRAADEKFIDLTQDSDEEPDIQEVFPKSKSLVGSDTDDGDSSDEELKLAIALSLEEANSKRATDTTVPTDSQKSIEKPDKPSEQPLGILGMDRKHMEKERLARQLKRKADDFIPASDYESRGLSTKARKANPVAGPESGDLSPFASSASRALPKPEICNRPDSNHPECRVKPLARSIPQFPFGAVKRTAIGHKARSTDEITIEEVLQRGELELAVLSSFLWDMEWLFTKMDTFNTRFILIMHAKEESTPEDSDNACIIQRIQYQEETASMSNLRLCFPPMEGQINCMHSKLMMLFHPTYMRIAIPTANLTSTDWGENNLLENTVFMIDLPKKGAESGPGKDLKPPFYEELVCFLKASTLHDNIIQKLENFDFSKTARYAFVHTIGGAHNSEQAWRRTGYPGLGRAVTNLGLQTSDPVDVDYVTSSVGSLNDNFVRAMHYACKGDDGLSEYILRNQKSPFMAQTDDNNRRTMLEASARDEWKERVRVYFPSDLTVRTAHAHPQNTAGTICFQRKWWNGASFPRGVLRDCEGARDKRILMHNKLIFVWPQKDIIRDKTKCTAWVYVGSANFSESAWGRLVKDRTTKEVRLNCRNWECGVIVPVIHPHEGISQPQSTSEMPAQEHLAATNHGKQEKKFPISDINAFVPVPMKIPAKTYQEKPVTVDTPFDRIMGSSGASVAGPSSNSANNKPLEPWFFMG
ncbi:uncharacterized protein N7477_004681 [Penicillium maclennaniae]|uniref:uncharacterized protein n=1 Tax=Penicillium maclennaniae TaxID=1343394 RepID=UPI00253FE18E|nr:uncharacterized protein N7477_004681 [Penicillium maclennaniae]KAJ5674747.1 hypothetical protein N7477_004681 [Penicillium maclennaniae]